MYRKKFLIFIIALSSVFFSFIYFLPSLFGVKETERLEVRSKENLTVRSYNSERGSFGKWTGLEEFPKEFIQIILFSEDKYFYYHMGFNPLAILRAFIQNTKNEKIISGASTITQQLARIQYEKALPENKILKKLLEICFALHLEMKYSKKQILEKYLNQIPIKDNLEGFGLPAEIYFQKNIRFLAKEEMVALSILPRSPHTSEKKFIQRYSSIWNYFFPDAKNNATELYKTIHKFGNKQLFYNNSALHFSEWISQKKHSQENFQSSISLPLNEKIQTILNKEIEYLNRHGASQSSAVVLKVSDQKDGGLELISIVGSLDFLHSPDGQVNGTIKIREAGSTLKPFVYALGFEKKLFQPNTILEDEEYSIKTPWQTGNFIPRNYDLSYWGPVTISEALCNSRNIPAVKAIERTGVEEFLQFLRTLNFYFLNENFTYYGPGLALGSGGTTLLDLTRAYSIFLNEGKLAKVKIGINNKKESIYFGEESQIISRETAAQIRYILSNKDLRRRAFGQRNFLDFPFEVASKTGTSKDYKDAWTIGFTNKYIVGVWVGDFRGKKMNLVSGAWGAGRSFHQIIRLLHPENKSKFVYPPTLTKQSICRKTGKRPNATCPVYMELVKPNQEIIDCHLEHNKKPIVSDKSKILSPKSGTIFVIDPYMPQENQKIPIRFEVIENAILEYSLDGKKFTISKNNFSFNLSLKKGRHELILYLDNRIIDTSSFVVK